jgi:chromosome partitioning protein
MRIIPLISAKGGVGKTTLATSLAVAALESGERAALFDLDPQGSAVAWGGIRIAEQPHVEAYPASRIGQLPGMMQALAGSGITTVFLDTQGADNPATHAAMSVATLALVPLRPTRLDANAVMTTIHALIRGQTKFAFVLTQGPTQPRNTRAAEMAAGLSALGLLAEPVVGQRADFQDAYAAGVGATEYAPASKAADEIRGLWRWIDSNTRESKS